MSFGFPGAGVQPSALRPDFDSEQIRVNLVAGVPTEVLTPNHDRIGLLIQNISITDLTIRFRDMAVSAPGITLDVGSAPLLLKFSDLGPIIGDSLFASSAGGAGRIFMLTSIDRSRRFFT